MSRELHIELDDSHISNLSIFVEKLLYNALLHQINLHHKETQLDNQTIETMQLTMLNLLKNKIPFNFMISKKEYTAWCSLNIKENIFYFIVKPMKTNTNNNIINLRPLTKIILNLIANFQIHKISTQEI